ncbi:orotate phosphoribosyltransferase [Salirhabdus euzebyi]|uniref:Orotate phosphoribosyltransferase n=1 Tax=Salirhabdus euzebyi TaxID=394506 RepID=A0A841Q3L5_9BACI|nr:orotate phosphoribosyltransferase [Salirhabdus euzebyi]MBB6452984.1 orotate phosphoribosyltransferase [Salirhabdus euzebyi]
MDSKKGIAEKLMKIGALQVRPNVPFTWASGIKSPIYCDNRLIMSFPKIREEIATTFTDVIKEKYPHTEVIAGCATAGIPHAAWVTSHLELPMIYVRGEAKSHGKQNQIEGLLQEGQKVVVIEDLVSTGKSVLNAVKAIEDRGAEVAGVISIFTYNLSKSTENFEAAKTEYTSLTDFDTLVSFMSESNALSEQEAKDLLNWRDSLS